ncbi:hypothetical protein [Botrimarina mediterranea]|uniref:ArnR1-like winged helix-turn-helix domain-containing protein n=1 Tax=Botrimarina mediterranea TaxID=2528022 RepID=A0A518K676_9BACT|nr:hypothetical protein [Botrimarina mediterranea]QDV73294.1 hypothetical protein Spa11_14900 [Botrimarina mediterranea]QDV77811.1 hypothetical protein K2D_14160 [Planctomycetes bacterium K2D]
MLTNSEQKALGQFREYLMTPNQMLCFSGPSLDTNRAALESLADKDLLARERPKGAYSLTNRGYSAMRSCR